MIGAQPSVLFLPGMQSSTLTHSILSGLDFAHESARFALPGDVQEEMASIPSARLAKHAIWPSDEPVQISQAQSPNPTLQLTR